MPVSEFVRTQLRLKRPPILTIAYGENGLFRLEDSFNTSHRHPLYQDLDHVTPVPGLAPEGVPRSGFIRSRMSHFVQKFVANRSPPKKVLSLLRPDWRRSCYPQCDPDLLTYEFLRFKRVEDRGDWRGCTKEVRAGKRSLVQGDENCDSEDGKIEGLTSLMLPIRRAGIGKRIWNFNPVRISPGPRRFRPDR